MDWMKLRVIYFVLSALIIGMGITGFIKWGLNLSVDFTGGSVIEYKTNKSVDQIRGEFIKKNPQLPIQIVEQDNEETVLRTGNIEQAKAQLPDSEIVRFESVGPTFSQEIFRKTLIGLGIASLGILVWIALQFKSITFGVAAIAATIHDVLVLLGLFAIFGHYFHAPVDILFATAILTSLSFSVYDTVVVFDRVRELRRKVGGNIYNLANMAISQTLVRSLNNSLTVIFVLIALALLGGKTLFWFVIALLIGTITGTYSSPFIAVPLLVVWETLRRRLRR